jgi:peroxiredoxin
VAAVIAVTVAIVIVGRDGHRAAAPEAGGSAGGRVVVDRAGGFRVGDQGPAFHTATTAGSTFALPAGKPAVVFFMATGCTDEIAPLGRLERDFGGRVAVLGVDPDPSDSPAALRALGQRVGESYGFVHDSQGVLAAAFGAQSLDTTVVVDAGGHIVYRDTVPTGEAQLRAAVAKTGLA